MRRLPSLLPVKPSKKFNPLPKDKILDWPILKAFADNIINVTETLKIVFRRKENTVGKEEDTGYLFSQCFQKAY